VPAAPSAPGPALTSRTSRGGAFQTPTQRRLISSPLPSEVARPLFNAWVQRLSAEQLGLTQYSSGSSSDDVTTTFGSPIEDHFILGRSGNTVTLNSVTALDADSVIALLEEALRRVAAGDHGQGVVYRVEMTAAKTLDFEFGGMHFMRMLGDQVHIEGSRRLSDMVVLDFEQGSLAGAPKEGLLFAPVSKVQATIFEPGHSDFSIRRPPSARPSYGRSLRPGHRAPRPAPPPDVPSGRRRRVHGAAPKERPAILGLGRDSIALDVFGELPARGGIDALLRARGAFTTPPSTSRAQTWQSCCS
jgi:hypothetical protein